MKIESESVFSHHTICNHICNYNHIKHNDILIFNSSMTFSMNAQDHIKYKQMVCHQHDWFVWGCCDKPFPKICELYPPGS